MRTIVITVLCVLAATAVAAALLDTDLGWLAGQFLSGP